MRIQKQSVYSDPRPVVTGKGDGPNPNFPLLITPSSVANSQALAANVPTGDGLGNLGGSHDAVFESPSTTPVTALLGGSAIETFNDSEGVAMLRVADQSGLLTFGNYVAGSGAAGPNGAPHFSADPRLAGGTTMTSIPPTANCLLWVNAYMPSDADVTELEKVGFDLGGFLYTPSSGNITGALGINLSQQGGAIDFNDGSTKRDLVALFSAFLPTASAGRVSRVIAVNGTGTGIGYTGFGNQSSGASSAALGVINDSTSSSWAKAYAGTIIHLGKNVSPTFGVYSMGVRNYNAAIPEYEVNRVANYLAKTGELPYWWK